jgi:hypothetical protein
MLFLFVFALASAQHIEVTSPKGGETWMLRSSKVITWTAKNFPAGTLARLVLLLNGDKVGDIAVKVPITQGSWTWAKAGEYIGGTAAAGKGYAVRVRDMNAAYPGAKSPATFTFDSLTAISQDALIGKLGGLTAINSIPVSSPAQGLAMEPGTEFFVAWDRSKIAAYPQVALDVFTPDKKTKVGPIGTSPSSLRDNTGKYEAIIFNARYEWGKDYAIRVATPDEKYIGWSGVFHITPLEAVSQTDTFTGSHTVAYLGTGQSDWLGCLNTMGQGANMPPTGFWAVGWENSNDDPAGPCWTYVGHIYRTIVAPSDIHQGFKVTKAVLRFAVTQGAKQTLYVLRRDASGDALSVAATTVATIGAWEFGPTIEVDVTAVVQAWCTGQSPNYGLIIRGGNENYDHNNVKARCLITQPQLVITQTVYK